MQRFAKCLEAHLDYQGKRPTFCRPPGQVPTPNYQAFDWLGRWKNWHECTCHHAAGMLRPFSCNDEIIRSMILEKLSKWSNLR